MMKSTLELQLQLLGPADWQVLRAARLQALVDAPGAFTSSYARESAWGEPEWRRLFDAASCIVAREAEKVVGLARSTGEPLWPCLQHLESVWVAPTHRRHGVLRTMLHDLAEINRRIGVTDLMLWVLEDNYGAQSAYEALGFEATGERQYLPAVRRIERHLRLKISYLLDS
jgi:ribosomal protein S18 acetylase RimI-like enzyme